jgi:hypothetical protein
MTFFKTLIMTVVLLMASTQGSAAEWPSKSLPMADLIRSNLANPFPTLYLINKDNKVVHYGKGIDSKVHETLLKLNLDSITANKDELAIRAGKAFKSLFGKAISYRLVMITIDDVSFGGQCEPCNNMTNYLDTHLPSNLVIEKLLLKATK